MRYLVGSIVFLLMGSGVIVNADPVLWDLKNVSFNDGGSASGSFIYDADLQDYQSWTITTTEGVQSNGTGGPFPGYTYNESDSFAVNGSSGCTIDFVAKSDPSQSLCLSLPSFLTDAGGAYPLLASSAETYSSGDRLVTAGTLEDPPLPRPKDPPRCGGGCTIPEPSTVTLLTLAIGVSFMFRHFRPKNA